MKKVKRAGVELFGFFREKKEEREEKGMSPVSSFKKYSKGRHES